MAVYSNEKEGLTTGVKKSRWLLFNKKQRITLGVLLGLIVVSFFVLVYLVMTLPTAQERSAEQFRREIKAAEDAFLSASEVDSTAGTVFFADDDN